MAAARSTSLRGEWAPVPGRRNAGSAWMGTPEIYFGKALDNSRLVKATDPNRTREIVHFMAATACLFVLVMVYALQHFSAIEYGYKIEALKKQKQELIESNRALRLEESALRDPERIDVLARQMGLESPQAGQVQYLDPDVPASGPVMARVSDVAVITVAQ